MFSAFQKFIPKHLLSRFIGMLAASELWIVKTAFIAVIRFCYDINLAEAERTRPEEYRSFNDFFTRHLAPGVRPISGHISSPADGTVAALGDIDGDTLIQSKGHTYSIKKLLADQQISDFGAGSFITIYLAPHNYHRVHMPCYGELYKATYIPGDLFSVNQTTATQLPDLFARNERLACRFNTANGPMAAVMVGAMLVAGIQPIWANRPYQPKIQVNTELKKPMQQGDELGLFQMGSTVILLFSERLTFTVSEGELVEYGQSLV